MVKRIGLFVFLVIILLNFVSAIDLDITSKPVSNSVILDLDEPAVFDLTIRNLGENDSFEIYSLVGVDIQPKSSFEVNSGETKIIRIQVMPQESLKFKRGLPFPFDYKIKNSKSEIQEESLSIKIVDLESSFSVIPSNINPDSKTISILIKNEVMFNFDKVQIKLSSAFFDYEDTISLGLLETKEFVIPLDKKTDELKSLSAGRYLMNSRIEVRGKLASLESQIKFLEQEGIESSEESEGFFIQRKEIVRKNVGNVKKSVEITYEKNLFSYLFTTTNIHPSDTTRTGFEVFYSWEKEIIPNEEYKVIVKTNWYFPILLIVLIIVIIFFIKRSIETDLSLKKHVSFVKTKGGQFALKISLRIRSKNFLERLHVIDKLPPLVKLYDKFGAIAPDSIDTLNKRLVWNIESLNKGEERIFTYIIYSKIGIVGKFELPSASATYEKDGKIKETTSNRSFFINEPKKNG